MNWGPQIQYLFPMHVPSGAAASREVQRRCAARVVAARASEVAIFRKIAEGKQKETTRPVATRAMSLASGAGNGAEMSRVSHSKTARLPRGRIVKPHL